MCYNGKCLHCIQVETGALIWAIISIGLSGLVLPLGLGVLIYFNFAMFDVIAERTISYKKKTIGYTVTGVTTIIMIIAIALIAKVFLFSMFLLVGVIKKRPGYVRLYFIHGVVKCVLFALIILIDLFVNGVSTIISIPIGSLFMVIGFGLYYLILRMIQMTYKKFSDSSVNQQFSNKNFVE